MLEPNLNQRERSKSGDHHRPSGEGWKRRCHQVRFTDEPAPSQSANPKMPPGKEGSQGGGSDLEELPELKATVASSCRGHQKLWTKKARRCLQNPTLWTLASGSNGSWRGAKPQIGGRNC